MASLETGIRMHLEGVSELPAEEQDHHLARTAPWYVQTELAMIAWLARLSGGSKRVLRFAVESRLPRLPVPEQSLRQAVLAPNGR